MASWPPVSERALIGKSIKRLDGPAKTQGSAKYAYDITRPGMLYGRLLGSPHPHARIRSIDSDGRAEGARRPRGARADRSRRGRSREGPLPGRRESPPSRPTTEEAAEDAIRLIKVDYEVLPHLATIEQSMRPEAPAVFPKGNVSQVSERVEGNVDDGLAKAAHIVEGLYSTQVQTHTQPRDARRRLRVGGRQAHGVGLDAGGPRARATASRRRSAFRRPTSA